MIPNREIELLFFIIEILDIKALNYYRPKKPAAYYIKSGIYLKSTLELLRGFVRSNLRKGSFYPIVELLNRLGR
jgi:hypothetical protein